MPPRSARAYAALLLLTAIWGYNWVVIKVATSEADSFSMCAIRSIAAVIALFTALTFARGAWRSPPVGPTIVLGLLQTTGFTLFQTLAIATGGAGKTAILAYTMPFWAVLLAWPFLDERVNLHGGIALALAGVGLALVLVPLDFAHGLLSKALALLAALSWGASAVYAKRFRARHAVDLLALTAWQMLYGTLPLLVIAALAPHKYVHVDATFAIAMAYVGVLGTGFAWLLWLFVLNRLTAGAAAVSSLLTPVVAAGAAWIQLGERPGTLELWGMACIVAALVVHAIPARNA
ncbi:MAG: DMT family transporter [Candidatus Velthaea sp.]